MTELRTTEVDTSHFRLRAIVIGAVVFLAFALVVARLVFLQVLRYEDFAERAESNRTAIIPACTPTPPEGSHEPLCQFQ